MSILTLKQDGDFVQLDPAQCEAEGKARAAQYASASPFPHIVMDDFIDPAMLRGLLPYFPDAGDKSYFDRDQERLKFQFQPSEVPAGPLRSLLLELNSPAMLKFLEEMTGISNLVPDPYYEGGGLHETRRGGHLGVHADFNLHERLNLERRLNLLIYLNDDWDDSYGGKLELWDTDMTRCQTSVLPVIGRAVVFSTTLDSYHGHPDPLTCPPDRSRRSIATYYYTAVKDGLADMPMRTTNFRPRPGTTDKPDRAVAFNHMVNDWVPPRLQRVVKRLNPFH